MTQEKDQNRAQQPEQQEGSIVEFVQCDLSDILSVKRAVDVVQSGTDRMDIMICNAGKSGAIYAKLRKKQAQSRCLAPALTPAYSLSRQKIEIMFAANCVGHHILVTSLLPLLKSAIVKYEEPDARVVVTTSSCHQFCREVDFDLLTSPKATKSVYYDSIWRYCRSKLGNILFTRELSRRLVVESLSGDKASSQIYVNCYVPGNIPTEKMDIFREYVGAPLGWAMKKYFYFFGHTEEDGAATGMFLAASPHVRDKDIRGEYFAPIARKDTTSALGNDKELGIKLWVSQMFSTTV